jgi:hypothetical protein
MRSPRPAAKIIALVRGFVIVGNAQKV